MKNKLIILGILVLLASLAANGILMGMIVDDASCGKAEAHRLRTHRRAQVAKLQAVRALTTNSHIRTALDVVIREESKGARIRTPPPWAPTEDETQNIILEGIPKAASGSRKPSG